MKMYRDMNSRVKVSRINNKNLGKFLDHCLKDKPGFIHLSRRFQVLLNIRKLKAETKYRHINRFSIKETNIKLMSIPKI